MTAGWFRRERPRSATSDADDVDARIVRQARRAGRTVAEEQEAILGEVLPNIRRAVADAGLTMGAYLDLNRVEYQQLLESRPGRSLLTRRSELVDYPTFVRLRNWIAEAAERAGEDVEAWVVRAGASRTQRPWERTAPAAPPTDRDPVSNAAQADRGANDGSADDALLDRLERLAALRDAGALTDDEFQAQKQRLLGGAADR